MTDRTTCQRLIVLIIIIFSSSILFVYLYSLSQFSYDLSQHLQTTFYSPHYHSNISVEKMKFSPDSGHWNVNLTSFLRFNLEADLTPDMHAFILNNKDSLTEIIASQSSIDEQVKHYGAMSTVATKVKLSANEQFILIFSRVWYSKSICLGACNPDRSYIYTEVLTWNYQKTALNMSSKNGRSITFPGILKINESKVDECCLGPEDPRIVLDKDNQLYFTFNMVDADRRRKIWFYDVFENYQVPLSIRDAPLASTEKNWTPFIKNDKLYFIYAYNPLKILYCPNGKSVCELISNPPSSGGVGALRGGTQLVRFQNSDYFVGIARTTISCQKCQRFYRPHLIVLSTTGNQFHFLYVSEPLQLDSIPLFTSYFKSKDAKSKDFCDNVIRIMTPGSIVDWQWPDDKLFFTVSINDRGSYLISMVGVGALVQNLISTIESKETLVNLDHDADKKMTEYGEIMAEKYCQTASQLNQPISESITRTEKVMKSL